jgi:hypothetical protein
MLYAEDEGGPGQAPTVLPFSSASKQSLFQIFGQYIEIFWKKSKFSSTIG